MNNKKRLLKKIKKILDENSNMKFINEYDSLEYHYLLLLNENENTESYEMLITEIKKDINLLKLYGIN